MRASRCEGDCGCGGCRSSSVGALATQEWKPNGYRADTLRSWTSIGLPETPKGLESGTSKKEREVQTCESSTIRPNAARTLRGRRFACGFEKRSIHVLISCGIE